MSCAGCGQISARKKRAFKGVPYDSNRYYVGSLAHRAGTVESQLHSLLHRGITELEIDPWEIKMSALFAEKRDYSMMKYGAVNLYLLIYPFGKDLYLSWISLFNVGCWQQLIRLFRGSHEALDVDDLEMLGQAVDLYIRDVLDRELKGEGYTERDVQKVIAGARRKRFVKA